MNATASTDRAARMRPSPPITEPRRLGSDGAGVVEAVGAGVKHFAAGDRVIGSFFESWLGGEPSEARMRAALGGSVDFSPAHAEGQGATLTMSLPLKEAR